MKTAILISVGALVGIAVELVITGATGRAQAFDSQGNYAVGYGIMCLTSGVLGYLLPRRKWWVGLVPILAQMGTMSVRCISLEMFPLIVLMTWFFYIAPVVCALIGATIKRAAT